MKNRIHLVVGDSQPQVYIQLRQPDAVLDVSNSQVLLKFKPYKTEIVLFQLEGELLPGTLQQDLINADLSQYPVAGSGGRVRFQFISGSLNIAPGAYQGEVEVVYSPGNTLTPYTKLEFVLREDF